MRHARLSLEGRAAPSCGWLMYLHEGRNGLSRGCKKGCPSLLDGHFHRRRRALRSFRRCPSSHPRTEAGRLWLVSSWLFVLVDCWGQGGGIAAEPFRNRAATRLSPLHIQSRFRPFHGHENRADIDSALCFLGEKIFMHSQETPPAMWHNTRRAMGGGRSPAAAD